VKLTNKRNKAASGGAVNADRRPDQKEGGTSLMASSSPTDPGASQRFQTPSEEDHRHEGAVSATSSISIRAAPSPGPS